MTTLDYIIVCSLAVSATACGSVILYLVACGFASLMGAGIQKIQLWRLARKTEKIEGLAAKTPDGSVTIRIPDHTDANGNTYTDCTLTLYNITPDRPKKKPRPEDYDIEVITRMIERGME